jgi:hypothetical protein
MPILDIEIVVAADADLDSSLAAKLADAAGEVFASVAGQTWVRLRPLGGELYAENGGLTLAIANVCDRAPETVHLVYRPAARGRVAFGGKLVGG